MSARDVMAEAIWLYEREIAGAPLPHPSWATFKANDPETAMIYETHAGSVDAALRAAGYAVVPVAQLEELADSLSTCIVDKDLSPEATKRELESVERLRAMIAAAGEPT